MLASRLASGTLELPDTFLQHSQFTTCIASSVTGQDIYPTDTQLCGKGHFLGVCLFLPLQQAGLAAILNIPSETTSEIDQLRIPLRIYGKCLGMQYVKLHMMQSC